VKLRERVEKMSGIVFGFGRPADRKNKELAFSRFFVILELGKCADYGTQGGEVSLNLIHLSVAHFRLFPLLLQQSLFLVRS